MKFSWSRIAPHATLPCPAGPGRAGWLVTGTNYTLVQLRYFVTAARHLSMTGASKELVVSQSAVSTAIALQRQPQPPKRRTAPARPRRRPERARFPGTARPDIPSPSPRRAPQRVPASRLKPQVRRTSRAEPCGTTPITSKAPSSCWSFMALANPRKAIAPVIGETGERLRQPCSTHSPTSPRGPAVPTRPNRNQDRSIWPTDVAAGEIPAHRGNAAEQDGGRSGGWP
ncbi:LysR family transcriptional regulator [Yinghuangia aomiensis]